MNEYGPTESSEENAPVIEKKIRWASALIVLGLLVQLLALTKVHPLSFVAFLAIGCPLLAAGIALYLISLVSSGK